MTGSIEREKAFIAQIADLESQLKDKQAEIDLDKEEIDKLSEQLERARSGVEAEDAQKKIDELNKDVAEYEKIFQDYEKKIKSLSSNLTAAKDAEDYRFNMQMYRANRKLNEKYQRKANVAQKQLKVVEAELEKSKSDNASTKKILAEANEDLRVAREGLEAANKEYEAAYSAYCDMLDRLDIGNLLLKSIIVPRFAQSFESKVEVKNGKLNNVKFSYALKAAKKSDKKFAKASKKGKQQELPDTAYSAIVSDCTERFDKFVEDLTKTEVGRKKYQKFLETFAAVDARKKRSEGEKVDPNKKPTTQEIVERIIETNAQWEAKDILKNKIVLALIVLGGVALIATSALFPSLLQSKQETTDARSETKIVEVIGDLNAEVEGITSNIEGEYKIIMTEEGRANLMINQLRGDEATKAVKAVAETENETDTFTQNYNKVAQAKADADNIITYSKDGSVAPDCTYKIKLDEYKVAVDKYNVDEATSIKDELSTMSDSMTQYKEEALSGVDGMLSEYGITRDELNAYLDQLKAPTVSFEFDQDALDTYGHLFKNSFGALLGVESCVYTKNTGAVEILVKCLDGKGKEYYNLLNYNIESGLQTLSIDDVVAPLLEGQIVSMKSFKNGLATNVEGQQVTINNDGKQLTGTGSIKYTTSAKYDVASDSTTFTSSAIVIVRDESNEVLGTKVVTVSKTFQGNVKASDIGDAMEKLLASKLGNTLGASVELASETEAEMN